MPTYSANSFDFLSRAPEQTRRVGFRLGSMLKPGDVLALHGDLGAGKTTLVQGIAQGWGTLDAVSSPTFVLANLYRRSDGQQLHHLDAYRLQNAQEAEDLDLDQMLETGTLIIEWPERILSALPADRLWVQLRWLADEQRGLVFTPVGSRFEQMVNELRHRLVGG